MSTAEKAEWLSALAEAFARAWAVLLFLGLLTLYVLPTLRKR